MVIFETRYLPAERRPLLAAGSTSVNSILTLTVLKHQILVPNPVVNKAAGNLDRCKMRFATCLMTSGVIDVTSSHASSLTPAQSVRVDTHGLSARHQGKVTHTLPVELAEGSNRIICASWSIA